MPQSILVTGAAGGSQGSTGRHITSLLLGQGIPVRAFVHKLDERAEDLRKLGAEVVQGDLLNPASIGEALKGISRAYFTYPVTDGLLEATTIFAVAAEEAKTELVVNNSQLQRKSPVAPSYRNMQHSLADQIFDWACIGVVHLHAPPYYENLRALVTRSVTDEDTIYLPWGEGEAVVPLTGGADVAATAAALLAAPGLPDEDSYELIGEALTVDEIVRLLASAVDRPIKYLNITDEQWVDAVKGRINGHAVDHLSSLWKYFRTSGRGKDDLVPTRDLPVTGKPLQTLEEFLKSNAEAFGGVRPAA
jgi:uncharacterized protein YbjT (DUF2867 family)